MTAEVIDFATRRPVTPAPAGYRAPVMPGNFGALARNRVAVARKNANLSHAGFAAMLAQLLGRPVSEGAVIAWETKATPPGDVLIAAEGM